MQVHARLIARTRGTDEEDAGSGSHAHIGTVREPFWV